MQPREGPQIGREHAVIGVARRLLVDVARGGDEADQVLDQRLGNRAVGIVVRHVIADAVGAPAQPELGEIAGSDHDPAVLDAIRAADRVSLDGSVAADAVEWPEGNDVPANPVIGTRAFVRRDGHS